MDGEGDRKMSPLTTGESTFVDREDETNHIRKALEKAKKGEGQLLLIRGEAGSGKTRLLQESVVEAEKQGFSVGFGSAHAETVVPYHAWKEALECLALDGILKEEPPPKLMGLYILTSEGRIQIKVERENCNPDVLSNLASTITDSVRSSRSRHGTAEEEFTMLSEDGHRLILLRTFDFYIGAAVEGQEDEFFLADLTALSKKAESIYNNAEALDEEEPHEAVKAQMQQLVDSESYEGIDYAKEDPKLRQYRLFEHVRLGILRKAGRRPICVVIDDLQWADPSSLALLQYAVQNTREMGVLFLGAYRVEEVVTRPHLRAVLRGMEREELALEMDLLGLPREYLANLVESFIGSHDLSEDFLDHLWEETRGFPLFVREVLFGLEDDEKIVTRGAAKRLVCQPNEIALPERVRDVIRARLDRLPSEDRQLLEAAATCGTRFTAAFVSKVAGEKEEKVLNGLSSIAMVHGLLRTVESGFTFNHPAVHEVVYEGASTEERRAYHREAAKWLEIAGGPVEDVAEHYYRARDARAVATLRVAASEARAKYANEEAIRFYTEALEFDIDSEGKYEILDSLGSLYGRIGNFKNAIESYQHALEFAKGDEKQAEVRARIAEIHGKLGEHGRALQACTEGMRLVGGRRSKAEASVLSARAQLHVLCGNPRLALEDHGQSLRIREDIGDEKGIVSSLGGLARAFYELREYTKLKESGTKMLDKSTEIEYPDGVMSSLNFLGVAQYNLSEPESALDYWKRSLHIAEKIGRADSIPGILNNIGNVYKDRENYDLAIGYYNRALEGFRISGYKEATVVGLNGLSSTLLETNDIEAAFQNAKEAVDIAAKTGLRALEAKARNVLARCCVKSGELQEALEHCDYAFAIATELGDRQSIASICTTYGRIYQEMGEWDKSTDSFQDAMRICEELGSLDALADHHLDLGVTWKLQGNTAKASMHLQKSIDMFERLGFKKRIAKARGLLSELDNSAV